MSVSVPRLPSSHQAAHAAMNDVLRTQWRGEPWVVVESPPGAGKTWLVEQLAAQAFGRLGQRCMVVTQTNQQAIDVATRLKESFPKLPATLFVRADLEVPPMLIGQ